jgi:hypothetical protein
LNWDQLVPHIVELNQLGKRGTFFEVERCGLKDIGAKFLPRLGLGKDAMTKGACAVTTLIGVANFENQLHVDRIPETDTILTDHGRL